MAKRRATIDNDHLTIVCGRKMFGLLWYNRIVANYETNLQETVMTSETYYNQENAERAAETLGKQLNMKVVIDES